MATQSALEFYINQHKKLIADIIKRLENLEKESEKRKSRKSRIKLL